MAALIAFLNALAALANAYAAWLKDDLANKPQQRRDAIFDRKCTLDKDVAAARAAGDNGLAQRLLDNWAIRAGAAVDLPTPIPSSNQG